jgi:biotin transport system permease protein
MLTLTSPVETPLHGVRSGVKLAALCGFTVVLFWLKDPISLALAALIPVSMIASGGPVFARYALRMLRPLWPFVVLLALWHWWTDDLAQGVTITLRLISAVAAANLVTMTTRLSDMLAVIEVLLAPLARFGLPPRRVALTFALVIRFIPVLAGRLTQITEAFTARSRRKPRWRVLVPATLAALDDADHVAEALRARGGAG